MTPQEDDIIEAQADIIEQLRVILIQEDDDTAVLNEARVALSDWFVAQYPHLYGRPPRKRDHLRLIEGGGRRSRRRTPLLASVEDVR